MDAHEHVMPGRRRAIISQIARNRFTHVRRQRHPRPTISFFRTNGYLSVFPVNVLDLKPGNLAGAQPEPG